MKRAVLILVVLLIALGVGVLYKRTSSPALSVPLCKDCNVVVLSLDTLSGTNLPCLGYARNTAPNLCAFGTSNLLFTHAYANATYTLPTYVSMFTGVLPSVHGIASLGTSTLSKALPFLPEILKNHGYETLLYMPRHSEHMPEDRVYNRGIDRIIDEFEASPSAALRAFTDSVSNGHKTFLFLHSYAVHPPYHEIPKPYRYTNDVYDWMMLRDSDPRDITPTFISYLVIALRNDIQNNVHPKSSPYQTLLERLRLAEGNTERQQQEIRAYPSILAEYRDKYDPLLRIDVTDTRELAFFKALYDQKIHDADEGLVSDVIQTVSRLPKQEPTVLIITSDHGEEFGEHGYISHTTLYEPNTHVVLMVSVPGISPRRIDTPVQTIDLAPTILSLVGIAGDSSFQGRDVSSVLVGRSLPERLLVAESGAKRTLRLGKWKLFYDTVQKTPLELYDIYKDPGERTNLLFSNMGIARRIMALYTSFLKQ